MKKNIKKIKLKSGKDANKSLVKKLLFNFLREGKMVTTCAKARILKSVLERVVHKSKKDNERNKNFILKYINDRKMIKFLFNQVADKFKNRQSGYIKSSKLPPRSSDSASMLKLEWVEPVIFEKDDSQSKAKKVKNKVNKND